MYQLPLTPAGTSISIMLKPFPHWYLLCSCAWIQQTTIFLAKKIYTELGSKFITFVFARQLLRGMLAWPSRGGSANSGLWDCGSVAMESHATINLFALSVVVRRWISQQVQDLNLYHYFPCRSVMQKRLDPVTMKSRLPFLSASGRPTSRTGYKADNNARAECHNLHCGAPFQPFPFRSI